MVIFEDDFYIIANKESGLLTHPSDECRQIKDNLLFRLRDHAGQYLYPVNRLDRAVSGITVFAKKAEYLTSLQQIWNTPRANKTYLALARGHISQAGSFNFSLSNMQKKKQEALTHYDPIECFNKATLVRINIETGRRHQIRRHFSRRMHAILGDRKYGKKPWNDDFLENHQLKRIFLHATELNFEHPYTNENLTVTQELPDDLQQVLSSLNEEKERT